MVRNSGVRRKISWEDIIQWHMVVICIRCALFVTSQIYAIFMFRNQRLDEVYRHNMHILLLHTLSIFCVIALNKNYALNINYQRFKLGYRRKIYSTLRHSSS